MWFPDYGNLLPTIRAMFIWTDVISGYAEAVTLNQKLIAIWTAGIFIGMTRHIPDIYIL